MSVWVPRYPEHAAVRRTVNGGLVRVCFNFTPGMTVSMRDIIKINGCTAFLSKLKHKYVK